MEFRPGNQKSGEILGFCGARMLVHVGSLLVRGGGESDAVAGRGAETADRGADETDQERDGFLDGLGDGGVEAVGDGASEQGDGGQCHDGERGVHEVVELELVLVAAADVEGAVRAHDGGVPEVGVPQPARRHEPVVDDPVLRLVAVREARHAAQRAQQHQRERRQCDLVLAAFARVRRQRRENLEHQKRARR